MTPFKGDQAKNHKNKTEYPCLYQSPNTASPTTNPHIPKTTPTSLPTKIPNNQQTAQSNKFNFLYKNLPLMTNNS
jgi:hypothetical protein